MFTNAGLTLINMFNKIHQPTMGIQKSHQHENISSWSSRLPGQRGRANAVDHVRIHGDPGLQDLQVATDGVHLLLLRLLLLRFLHHLTQAIHLHRQRLDVLVQGFSNPFHGGDQICPGHHHHILHYGHKIIC